MDPVIRSDNIYMPHGLEGYELCHPDNQEDFERINVEVNGASRKSEWRNLSMRLIREDEGRKLIVSDSPWLGAHALIFRPKAIERMGSLLRENGELLALSCMESKVDIYNPTRLLDALDEAASSMVRFSSGRIMMIQRYVFRRNIIRDVDIFKIPNLRVSPTFVSQRFVDLWKANGLTGLGFKKIWG